MMTGMEAKIVSVWLVVECPNCHAPQVVNKYVNKNIVYNLMGKRHLVCDICDGRYFVEIHDKDISLDDITLTKTPEAAGLEA